MRNSRSAPIRIVIAEDHALVREAVSLLLSREPDLEVVAEAADGPAAVRGAVRGADVVLLAPGLPGRGPVQTLRDLRTKAPRTRVVLLSESEDDGLARTLLAEGAHSCVPTRAPSETLLRAVRAAAPETLETPETQESPAPADEERPAGRELLTERELEVLRYVGQALSNRQIGNRLTITEGTVKRHLQNIFAKLDARSRIDAVNKYRAVLSTTIPTPTPTPTSAPTRSADRTPEHCGR
ncbi:LuxR C-terminal-related transcriptional regulator [Streptomyces sp. NPDC014779]|uniref:LuxR C-terminal-related transcriptional regulator n=1 Tax=unclassified Streptomyces TaxID=2593676 RepID=UPI0037010A59